MRVGFIGLGIMGASLASNLQKAGYDLVVHDLSQQMAQAHLAAGAIWAETPRALAETCDIILTSLPGPSEIEAVALDRETGLLAGVRPGTVYFDLSTNSPTPDSSSRAKTFCGTWKSMRRSSSATSSITLWPG